MTSLIQWLKHHHGHTRLLLSHPSITLSTGKCWEGHWTILREHRTISERALGNAKGALGNVGTAQGSARGSTGQCQVSREQYQGSPRQHQVSTTRPVTCQGPALRTPTHHINSHRQQQLCHCPAPSEIICTWHVPGQAARWDSRCHSTTPFLSPVFSSSKQPDVLFQHPRRSLATAVPA